MAILSLEPIILKVPQGIMLVIFKVIPCKDLEMYYQRMILDIADLLGAPRIEDLKATSKVVAKAKWPCGDSQGEGPSKKSKISTSSASYSPFANFGCRGFSCL